MNCPFCSGETKVTDKRSSDEETNRRRRECLECGKRFTTYEKIELVEPDVIKKDGTKQKFEKEKVFRGIKEACKNRPISDEKIWEIVKSIVNELQGKEEVQSTEIGNIVLSELKKIDKIAYLRFASVYKSFNSIRSFEEELSKLRTKKVNEEKIHRYNINTGKILFIRRRSGKIEDFDPKKINEDILKAIMSVGEQKYPASQMTLEGVPYSPEKLYESLSKELSDIVISQIDERFEGEVPTTNDVQDLIEEILIEEGHSSTAKEYILQREHQRKLQETKRTLIDIDDTMNEYIQKSDWRVNENSNIDYSLGGLILHVSGKITANYWLNHIYTQKIRDAHNEGEIHIHDLSMFSGYCAGWSLRQFLLEGFGGVKGHVQTMPPKHLGTVVSQMVNFIGTLQNEWAGAQAFSSVDTYLAPFIKVENLSEKEVSQAIQQLVFHLAIPTRWGTQTAFTNFTFDWIVPDDMKNQPAIVGGKLMDFTYGDCQKEMDIINKIFLETMIKGDAAGRIFTFPLPTYNITKDFDWESPNAELLFKVTSKYGIPYFQNFINSDLKPSDVRSMCCRLRMDLTELRKKTGGIFGAGESTGSVGVVTINMPRLGYTCKTREELLKKLEELMVIAKDSLEIKRDVITKSLSSGLLPFTKRYLGHFNHHFSTIGLNGMHECCLNFLGKGIESKEGREFSIEVLKFMRDKIKEFQEETSHIYNLEATPGEGTSYRFARIDKKKFPKIISSGENEVFYTGASLLPSYNTDDAFEALDHQDDLQVIYTGGTVFHCYLGEKINDPQTCKKLIKTIAENYRLPYFTISPTFSVCADHGYLSGEIEKCPTCGKINEVYSRVVGYIRPTYRFNKGKQEEFRMRKNFSENKLMGKITGQEVC